MHTIIGQEAACTQLMRAYQRGRLSHAYIFEGPAGVGKYTTAHALARWLLCAHPTQEGACGICNACRQMAAGTHPDYHCLVPDGRSIKIKQVRALRLLLANTAVCGGMTVVVIDGADTMGVEAANALLKTIEEPQGPTCFILLVTAAERLPDTIRSRAQLIPFYPLKEAAILRILEGQASLETVQTATALAGGSVGRAKQLLAEPALCEALQARKKELVALLDGLPTSHDGALLRFADAFSGDREGAKEEILLIRQYLRQQMAQALRDALDTRKAIQALHYTTTALERLETNTEPAFVLGALLITMAQQCR